MFEDIDNDPAHALKRNAQGALEVSRDAEDRTLVYILWARGQTASLAAHEAWGILHQRYPDDPRFLLFNAYEELASDVPSTWSPSSFLDKVRRILDAAGGRLHPEVRDLLAFAEDNLHPLSEDESARLDRIRARVGARGGDATAARKRFTRLASDVVRELHDRSASTRSIGQPASTGRTPSAAAAGASDWKSAVAAAKSRKPYAATDKVAVGDVVEHPKFGAGVVVSIEPGRAQILFESGARKLVVG